MCNELQFKQGQAHGRAGPSIGYAVCRSSPGMGVPGREVQSWEEGTRYVGPVLISNTRTDRPTGRARLLLQLLQLLLQLLLLLLLLLPTTYYLLPTT